ncbi:GlsB/YeaQ/YmgE family stress response membrane protein [Pandoraea nosoerga]|uniref:Transglycosylase n=1 Tax=Pandoraea nosoerga TaxID=2508296 RepID=A0A5E4VXH6_9BURK|nr:MULTISPECIES: GlsB/YeaQ/YmgE family stress response membrane protein [Pandoraea]MBN4667918.1 GlsB/YeaQ/YmgE family stress response membrane protein [Pandoraea nosoerga]MBN4677790.1 GlsB/YeaQ/YmgE family stress response membrane protein [Pandoraea nosoerga]MBN4682907.1 GlsB/YeaQ/YmgE family stress response membrane protein [Pandoraea nosoerga]MBN4746920.1 GlsB/YeaQ/YmgE family stress response membrane protein [Pandoraea nosoerga]VVE15730.1 transglycosylase [Pandoraea nosoerga]
MGIIGTIVVGLIVGLVARALHPGRDNMGIIMTIILGIAGALLAKYVGQALHLYTEGQSAGWIASILGAIVLLVIYGILKRNRTA